MILFWKHLTLAFLNYYFIFKFIDNFSNKINFKEKYNIDDTIIFINHKQLNNL